MNDCIKYAYSNNVVLNQQILTTEISGINYQQARSNRLPNLNFTDAQSFNFGNTINNSSNQVIRQNTISNYPSLMSTINLFSGFKLMNLVKENKKLYDAGKLDIETQKNDLALNVTAAYIQILFENDAIVIAQDQVAADSVLVKKVAKYVEVGSTPQDSLYLIIAQLYADMAVKINAESQLALYNVQLEQLIEIPIITDFNIVIPDREVTIKDITTTSADIYNIASSILPDEKSAALKTNAFELDESVKQAALLPVLNLSGSFNTAYYSVLTRENYQTTYQNETIGYLLSNPNEPVTGLVPLTTGNTQKYPLPNQFADNFSQLITLNLLVPIFNNYTVRNNIRISKIAIENARLNEQAVKNTLRNNVELAFTSMVSASKNFVATKEQLASETKAYNDMKIKYAVGLVSTTDFLVEENNYYKVTLANLQAKYEYIFKNKIVGFYTGTPLAK